MGRIADAFCSKHDSPSDYVAAHEPAERMLKILKDELHRRRALLEAKLSPEKLSKIDAGFAAFDKLIDRPMERIIERIRAAHAARADAGRASVPSKGGARRGEKPGARRAGPPVRRNPTDSEACPPRGRS